jgi:hypothetical protein
MKRKLSLVCAALVSTLFSVHASATTCGAYLGYGVGKSWVKIPSGYLYDVPATSSGRNTRFSSGTGQRAFVGFNLNKYFGIEGGYTHYARAFYAGSILDPTGAYHYSSLTYYIHTYDVVGKAYFPVGNTGFNVYALAGLARVVESVQRIHGGVPSNGKIPLPPIGTTHGYNNRPIYGIGANYNINAHFTVNTEVTQIQKLNDFGRTTYAVPFLDLFSVNIAYNFG